MREAAFGWLFDRPVYVIDYSASVGLVAEPARPAEAGAGCLFGPSGGKILVSMELKALSARYIYGITPLIIIHAYNLLPLKTHK